MLLKDYLIKKGIPIKDFGKTLNLSKPHIYALVRGCKKPSLELAVIIEEVTENEVKPRDFIIY
jgi:plasmid maintenance system antidote protein VapI